jgi:hypothetical protein
VRRIARIEQREHRARIEDERQLRA